LGDLQQANLSQASVPVVANVTATEETEPDMIRENLARQVTGTVLWQPSVELLLSQGVTTFVEVGCGKVLQGLVKRICMETMRMGVEDSASLETTAGALQEQGFAHDR
jgi:[acyl-carrier-protein] S-malonyltransferase